MKSAKLLALAACTLAAACGGTDGGTTTLTLTSATAISTFLEGKTMVMTGADIPTSPNGFSENVNYGASTQCYNKTSIQVASGVWNVTTLLGTLNGAPTALSVGTCDRTTVKGSALTFSSTAVQIANVSGNATCFDVTVTYAGFTQEGRGDISADGKTVQMELYFGGKATGHRCADGAVGASTVKLGGVAFSGNAVQTYRIQ
jgi:hypothetical protein